MGILFIAEALTYTRYADDMTFSSKKRIAGAAILEIKAAIVKSDFVVNEQKVHLRNVQKITC